MFNAYFRERYKIVRKTACRIGQLSYTKYYHIKLNFNCIINVFDSEYTINKLGFYPILSPFMTVLSG